MSDNTTATIADTAPTLVDKPVVEKDTAPTAAETKTPAPPIPPETQKVIEKSQLIQAEIQEGQIDALKAVYDLIKRIDEKKKNEIEKQFEEGIISLEQIDEDDNVSTWTCNYRPLTTRGEEAVNKMLRELKLFRRDIKNKLPLEDLQAKYPELTKDIESLEELEQEKVKTIQRDKDGNPLLDSNNKPITIEEDKDSDIFLNLVDTYSVKKRAKIFFKIDDISNFSKKDLRLLIYLYQYRNNYNPYYVNQT